VKSTADPAVPAADWSAHQRLHQYNGGQNATYGHVTINIDGDYVDAATAGTPTPVSTPAPAPAPAPTPTPTAHAYCFGRHYNMTHPPAVCAAIRAANAANVKARHAYQQAAAALQNMIHQTVATYGSAARVVCFGRRYNLAHPPAVCPAIRAANTRNVKTRHADQNKAAQLQAIINQTIKTYG